MLAFTQFVCFDLQKTGCTFLRDALIAVCREPPVENRKHAPLVVRSGIPRIMTIREPLQYMVSLWKYGLDGRGGFHQAYRASHPLAYAERTPRAFMAFLDLALNSGVLVGGPQPLVTDIYTGRIIHQLVPVNERGAFFDRLGRDFSLSSLMPALSSYLPDVLLRTESLNRDFHTLVECGRLDFIPLHPDWRQAFPVDAPKTNFSTGDTVDAVDQYYDESCRQKVLSSCGLALALIARAGAELAGSVDVSR
jgi:hypothetical protein